MQIDADDVISGQRQQYGLNSREQNDNYFEKLRPGRHDEVSHEREPLAKGQPV